MNKSKKLTAAVAASAVASALVAPAAFAATTLTDIDGSFAKDAIKELVDKGIINGKGDGKFDPTGKIERQDFAIILAKALNLDVTAAPATATFSDVPTSHYAYKYVEAAVKAGLIKGEGNGAFGAGANLSRQDMAVLFVRALGTDVTGKGKNLKFSDAGQIADYAKDAVAAAVELGLIAGNDNGTFDPTGNAERQAVALVASKFLAVKDVVAVTGATVVDKKTVTVTFNKAVEKLEVADLKVAVKATGAAVNVVGVTLSADKKSATVTTADLAAGTTFTLTYAGKSVEFATAVATKLEATAVSTNNLKSLVVTFNNELDEKSATTAANYKLNDTTLTVADVIALNADKKSVTITLADATDFQGANQSDFTLTVTKVADVNGNVVDDTDLKGNAFDVTIPVAQKVEQVGPSKLQVTFSEPVQLPTVTSFSVDGGEYFVNGTSIAQNAAKNVVTFDLYTTLPEGEHTVSVKGVKDYADYSAVTTDLKFAAVVDATAPTLSKVVSATPDQVVLEFSENISVLDATSTNFYHTNSGNTPDSVTVVNGNQLKLSFNNHKLPKGTAYLYIAKDVIADGWNNKAAAVETSANVVVDTLKPEVKKVEATDDKTVVVTFSEDVDTTTAEDEANYTVLDSTGAKVETAFTATQGATDKNVVTLAFTAVLPGSTYTVVTENVKDVAGNVINKIQSNVAITDTTDPAVKDLNVVDATDTTANGYLYKAKKIVKVAFTEVIKQEDLMNLGNYQLAGKYLSGYKVTASVTDNGKAVLFDFSKETALTLTGGETLNVGKVHDLAGNVSKAFITPVVLEDQDVAGVDIESVKATGTKTVVVTLKDALSKFSAADFVLQTDDGTTVTKVTPASVKFANVDGKGVITFTLKDADALTTDAMLDTLALQVTTAATTTSANAYGVLVNANQPAADATDKIVAAVDTVPNADGKQVANVTFASNQVTIDYSEAMNPASISTLTYTVAGYTVTGVTVTDDKVVLTVSAAVTAPSTKPAVTQAYDIQDAAKNVLKGGTTYNSLN